MKNENAASFLNSTIAKNPVLILFLGACPAMEQTANVVSALGIGLAALAVMLLSNIVISLVRGLICEKARIPVCVLVVTFFVSAVQMLMNAYLPEVYPMLGVYAAVLAVNLLVVYEAENSASRGLGASIASALLNGICFTAVLFVMAAVREILGSGSFAGKEIEFFQTYNIPVLAQAPGGFIVFALMLAPLNKLSCAKQAGSAACAAAGCESEN